MGAYRNKNPFNKKNWYKNFEQIFGDNFATWFLPVNPQNRETDGIDYPRNSGTLALRSEDALTP